jgi:hypothetical protein
METPFHCFYNWRRLTEIPERPACPCYYYPGASQEGGQDGVIVEVLPQGGQPWLGTFAFGDITTKGVCGVFAMPQPHRLCVVARGAGYLVRADDPTEWEVVAATPVLDVRPIRTRSMLVFADYTRLTAYGPTGLKWRTKRLTWDDLTITEVTDELIRGEYWDVLTESSSSFCVDLDTGRHEGGIPDV